MIKSSIRQAAGLLTALGCLLPLAAAAQTATATLVCESCWISGISADGKHATGQYMDNYETFSWKHGGKARRLGRSTVDVLGVSGGWPSISADGRTIGSSILSDDGTLMTSGIHVNGAWSQIGPLPDDAGSGDSQDSAVWAISGDGATVSGLYWRYGHTGGSAHPYYWRAGEGMVGLQTISGSGRINGSSKDGKVLTGWQESPFGGWVASVWVDGVGSMIGNPEGWGMGQSVSPNGKFIAGQDSNPDTFQSEAALWSWNGTSWDRTGLGVLKGTVDGEAFSNGVSANGKVVVGWGKKYWGPGGNIGFVWTKNSGKLQTAKAFFAKYGYSNADFDIGWVMGVSPDAKSFAVVEMMNKAPWTMRSQIITLSKAAE
jgi:hypothetical protein